MKNVFEVFNSLHEFEHTINTRPVNKVFTGKESSLREGELKFFGTACYNDANDLLLSGDKEALKSIQKNDTKKIKVNYTSKTKNIRGVAGGRPLVPAYLAGAPDCMTFAKRSQTKSRVISVVVNLSANGSVKAEKLAAVGAHIASEISTYEANGVRCNVYVCDLSKKSGQTIGCFVKIKNANAPLNRLNIAYPIINPSMMRRHGFRWVETQPEPIEPNFRYGYGQAANITQNILNEIRGLLPKGCPVELYNVSEMIEQD